MGSPAKRKMKGLILIIVLNCTLAMGYGSSIAQMSATNTQIMRITRSENAIARYPSLSNDGQKLLYLSEVQDPLEPQKKIRSIKMINADGTGEKILFADKTIKAPSPHDQTHLLCGTRPPQLSGDGTKAVFTLSISEPSPLHDHYLGLINTDGSGFRVFELKNEALSVINWQEKGFIDPSWSRISNYAVSNDGRRLVMIVKGHSGPRRLGFPSALLTMYSDGSAQRALISPTFGERGWEWKGYPRKPYTQGGWAFAFSGNGEQILFGAQSSAKKDDYDLHILNWNGSGLRKITNFRDRFFSLADLSNDGKQIVFFYGGKKYQGIGTYMIRSDGTGLEYVKSKLAGRVDFEDMDPDGKMIIYRYKYSVIVMDLKRKKEVVILHPNMPGYTSSGEKLMDFPYFPSFWNPCIMSRNKVVITGTPQGRVWRELYLATFATLDTE